MSDTRYLIDTSALARFLRQQPATRGWERAARSGLIAICPIVELETLYSARSIEDRRRTMQRFREIFVSQFMPERAFERADSLQQELTQRGEHRSAGPVDLLVAATAELARLTLLHHDHDFDCIARVTGQPTEWFD
ncbi:PIN domain nuclease [Microlunatus elymi]|uniref:Ribonuclease VapC n=1 Tax=Microlunatus elymi TaxID=2596828 RepID=A0A516PYB1_9ACTN|nr:PIN domain nuclease [Microlunatus elymi]QDP96157.1 PIN domain nuclease [Microlunatus elymi]